jgi:predicted nucleic-acid-binding Zn-ribbon protein
MMYKCPKCGSDNTHKDRIMGSDTMDRKCGDCGYMGVYREFKEENQSSGEEKAK